MKKQILACLAALLLILSLAACKKSDPKPGGGDSVLPPSEGGEQQEQDQTDGGNTNEFFDKNGYTEDFSVRFCKGNDLLDTAEGKIVRLGVTYGVDFADVLAAYYNAVLEHNFKNLPEDMTTKALTGVDAPEGTEIITLTVTELGETHTVTTDAAALSSPTTSHLSNLSALVEEFSGLLMRGAENAAPKSENQ